jgi:hypothetical protein
MDPSTRLAISVADASGQVLKRWGADERAVGDIPRGLGFSTSDPGGFKDASLALSRDIDKSWPDLQLLRDINIYGLGGRTAWEGRLHEIPMHHADDTSIAPSAVGHVARLDDDPSFAEIYIDADVQQWIEPTIGRRVALVAAGAMLSAADVAIAGGQESGAEGPGIVIGIYNFTAAGFEWGEMNYYGGGVDIGLLRYDFKGHEPAGDPNWEDIAFLGKDDVFTGSIAGTDHDAKTEQLNKQVEATGAGFKWAGVVTDYRNVGYVGVGNVVQRWTNLKVIGRHGLSVQGVWPAIGFYGSDVVADIVRRTASDLNFTTGPEGSIADSTFVIPHIEFKQGVKGSDAILGVNAFHQRSWGVYDNKTFFWRPTTSYRKRWRIRRSKGHGIDLLGPQAEDAVNGVVGTFTDAGGVSRVVGPPGCPTAFATSESLADTSPTNPVNIAGIPRKWAELKLEFVTTTAGAIQVLAAWLTDKLTTAKARGSVVVTGLVEDDATGTLHPAWAMRAGDSAIVTDGDNIERGIIETNYDHDNRTCTCNLDATPHKIEALMERMGVVLVGVTD